MSCKFAFDFRSKHITHMFTTLECLLINLILINSFFNQINAQDTSIQELNKCIARDFNDNCSNANEKIFYNQRSHFHSFQRSNCFCDSNCPIYGDCCENSKHNKNISDEESFLSGTFECTRYSFVVLEAITARKIYVHTKCSNKLQHLNNFNPSLVEKCELQLIQQVEFNV